MKEKEEDKLLGIIRLGGYLVLIGVVVGAGIGVYAVVNPWFFSRSVHISLYEAMGFFLGVNLPSFVVIVALGYIFVTTLSVNSDDVWRAPSLSILSFVCLVLSALSVFNFISLFGSFLVLIGAILAYTRPTFKALSEREACFFLEIGAVLVASFSMLSLLMGLVSEFLPTYLYGSLGFGSLYPFTFLILAIISFLTFFVTLFLSLRSAHIGACGALNLVMIVAVSAVAIRILHIYKNLSGYLGVFMLIAGITSAVFGALIHIRLFFSRVAALEVPEPSFHYDGKYCAYCGTPLATLFETHCSRCGRRLTWKTGGPFCPYCGRVVPRDVHVCPHCQETLAPTKSLS